MVDSLSYIKNLFQFTGDHVVDIQSGDEVIVEINDEISSEIIKQHSILYQVYQVTRLGYDHCDITEGEILVNIS